ncbi:hypothetical protein PIB30_041809 [Stylosanthes scabra]|uniref:Uncharacterized protein n=1 Tax=Stylosanthes scabra TaxID=79078 RepID=A0ABU6ZDT2_9FABA|nr:hypothetical protein [Stylosanthes scabra]
MKQVTDPIARRHLEDRVRRRQRDDDDNREPRDSDFDEALTGSISSKRPSLATQRDNWAIGFTSDSSVKVHHNGRFKVDNGITEYVDGEAIGYLDVVVEKRMWKLILGQTEVDKLKKKKKKEAARDKKRHGLSDDEGLDSDELDDICSEDDEGGCRRKFPVHKELKDMHNYRWEVRTLYATRDEFKDAITTLAVHDGRNIKFPVVNKVRVRAKCEG